MPLRYLPGHHQRLTFDESRFWAKVDKHGPIVPPLHTPCWLWTAGVAGNGYGAFKVYGEQYGAHVFSWVLAYGPVPEGLWVLHTCDTPLCVNPNHLRAGTPSENSRERDDKFRRARVSADHRGEANPNARITETEAIEIIALLGEGQPRKEIAALYGVKTSLVNDIAQDRCWRYIARPWN